MKQHPYDEIAAEIEARLRAQRDHDWRGTGVCLFSSEREERSQRAYAASLRDLAKMDRMEINLEREENASSAS